MPSALIEVRQYYTPIQEQAIMQAVYQALSEAFASSPDDINIRLVQHEAHRFMCSPNCSLPARYTHITLDAFNDCSLSKKRKLYKNITLNLESLDIPRDYVNIVLRESSKENWGIRGGQAACDVEWGLQLV